MELANFPMLSQRDGDLNQDYDCVAASIAACLTWLTHKPFSAREVKDACYGASYIGGTAAFEYVGYCAGQGVTLATLDGDGAQLVADLHQVIGSGHPALITEPDPYSAGWTHVCAAYRTDSGSVTVMDPWISAPVTKSDSTWATQLQDNQIWVMSLAERTTWMSAGQAQQASAYWGSTFLDGFTPNYATGIARAWQTEYMNGHVWGPPLSHEVNTVDWNGAPIVAQMFAGGRCEWQNGQAKWYAWNQ
jgi:hypothetical protein